MVCKHIQFHVLTEYILCWRRENIKKCKTGCYNANNVNTTYLFFCTTAVLYLFIYLFYFFFISLAMLTTIERFLEVNKK